MFAGRHKARAIGIDFGIAETGTEQVAIAFEVTEGDAAGEVISWFGYFTDKTTKGTIQAMRACGWRGDDLAEVSADDLLDAVEIVVQEEQDREGNPRLRVRWVNRPGSGTATLKQPMTPEQRKAFAARMRGACMAEKPAPVKPGNGGAKPAKPPAERMRQPGEDDIPF
jgi:hypothetical protein